LILDLYSSLDYIHEFESSFIYFGLKVKVKQPSKILALRYQTIMWSVMFKPKPRTSHMVNWINNKTLSRLTKSIGRKNRVIQIIGNLIELEKNLGMNQREIHEYQNRKLRRLILHAYSTVPFYHRLFDKNKIDPNEVSNCG
jgi:hypothetical protein